MLWNVWKLIMNKIQPPKEYPVICWWSGGVTSAVATKLALDIYSKNKCHIIFIDTKNEDDDTYRFKKNCEKWYGKKIEIITGIFNDENEDMFGVGYESIQDVWLRNKTLNVANGAVCSSRLKKYVREGWQQKNKFSHQVFGFQFDSKEFKRALSMTANHPEMNPIYPLLLHGIDKQDCFKILEDNNIEIPNSYKLGFNNNNCFKTGCIQGGIGYWQKIKKEFPDKFNKMAEIEHQITNSKGKPVTILRDQSTKPYSLVFLKKHIDYPKIKCIDDMKGRPVLPLLECNGFCGTNDFNVNETSKELNLEDV